MLTPFVKSFFISSSICFCVYTALANANELKSPDHEKWLQDQYGAQHQKLIPVVAVADMFFTCNNESKARERKFTIDELVNKMTQDELANRLADCLGEHSVKSDKALDYGLAGCFNAQLSHLSLEERTQKMKLVNTAIAGLSRAERKKSFTQCVTDQAIQYLK